MAIFAILIPLMIIGLAVAVLPLLGAMRHQSRSQAKGATRPVAPVLPLSSSERRGALLAA